MFTRSSIILAGGLAAMLVSHGAAAETLTGCLTKDGRLVKLAVGDMPARPCGKHQQEITLHTGMPEPEDTRIVFVTSETFTGNLGGIAGADAKCQALADAAGLDGAFRTWLSDTSSSPAADPTFYKHDGPYVRVDGVKVAQNWEDLTDGTLLAQIEVDETGAHPYRQNGNPSRSMVFTHGNAHGEGTATAPDQTCMDWTSAEVLPILGRSGWFGGSASVSDYWAQGGGGYCKGPQHLYCFEQ